MVEGMPNGFSRVIELSGDLSDGHAIAPSPPNRAVVIHRKHFLCLRASEPIPVGTFTIHGCARVGPSYALILPPGGSLLRAHFQASISNSAAPSRLTTFGQRTGRDTIEPSLPAGWHYSLFLSLASSVYVHVPEATALHRIGCLQTVTRWGSW